MSAPTSTSPSAVGRVNWRAVAVWSLCGALALEVVCAASAYFTRGLVVSGLLRMLMLLNVVPVLLLMYEKERAALAFTVLVVVLIVPYEVPLGLRYLKLKAESERFIEHVESVRDETGDYPEVLDDYDPGSVVTEETLWNYVVDERRGYVLSWTVFDPGLRHSYTPARGWFYYPD